MAYIPQIVRYQHYKKPRIQSWYGSLYLKGDDGGMARKISAQNMDFTKTSTHSWGMWVWFDADDDHVNTLTRLGTPSSNGYRIVKSKSGDKHILSIQEMKTFTATTFVYPPGFDVTKPHYVHTGFTGASDTSVTTWCYIDKHEIRTKLTNMDWSKAVAINNPTVIIGSDYPAETLHGHINDVVFYATRPSVDNIYKAMWKRNYKNAVAFWRCDENGGSTVKDLIGSNDLTIAAPGVLKFANQSWPPLPGSNVDPTTLTLVDPNMIFNYGNNGQSGTGYYDPVETAYHLDFMWEIGCREIRMPFGSVTFPDGVAVTTAQMEQAIARGFDVIAVGGTRPPTDANWESHVIPDMLYFAEICKEIGVTHYQPFNEIDGYETNAHVLTNSVPKQHDAGQLLIDEGYTDYFDISVAILQSSLDYVGAPNGWHLLGKGPFDDIGYNCYGDQGNFEQFKQRITDLRAAIPELWISEWNIRGDGFNLFPATAAEQKARIQEKLLWLMSIGIKHAFFNFYWPQQNDAYALLKGNDQFREWYEVLLKAR